MDVKGIFLRKLEGKRINIKERGIAEDLPVLIQCGIVEVQEHHRLKGYEQLLIKYPVKMYRINAFRYQGGVRVDRLDPGDTYLI